MMMVLSKLSPLSRTSDNDTGTGDAVRALYYQYRSSRCIHKVMKLMKLSEKESSIHDVQPLGISSGSSVELETEIK